MNAAMAFLSGSDPMRALNNMRSHRYGEQHRSKQASFPETWSRTYPRKPYKGYYTLNDNLAGTVADTLVTALEVDKDKKDQSALVKLGDFLLRAQMPELLRGGKADSRATTGDEGDLPAEEIRCEEGFHEPRHSIPVLVAPEAGLHAVWLYGSSCSGRRTRGSCARSGPIPSPGPKSGE